MYQQITLLVGLSPTPPIASGPPADSCSTAPTARLSLALADSHFKRSHKWPSLVRRFSHILMSDLLWKMRMWKSGLPSSRLGANVKTAALKGPWGLDDALVDSTIIHRAILCSLISLWNINTKQEESERSLKLKFNSEEQFKCAALWTQTLSRRNLLLLGSQVSSGSLRIYIYLHSCYLILDWGVL